MTAPEIKPLREADLEDLSRFLTTGFHTPANAVFAAPAVLRWKYLDVESQGDIASRSYVARNDAHQVVGHVGICRTFFQGASIAGLNVQTLHMIDWLGSPAHRSIGASLMRKAHQHAPTQFGLGGSEAGRSVIKRGGYEPRELVTVYQRVLRPSHWLRHPNDGTASRLLHAARDLTRGVFQTPRPSRVRLKLHKVSKFTDEISLIVREAATHAILTDRLPARLNHLLHFPNGRISGWYLLSLSGDLCGFALLNVLPQQGGTVHLGKIIDCLLPTTDASLWHAAIIVLTSELIDQGADLAEAFASTPWMTEALVRSGFRSRFTLEFSVRDRHRLIPHGIPVHLMPIEADYAYS